MATHLPSTAPPTLGTNAANKTNTASLLMEDDTFDLDDAALAAAVDSIIENHNKESEKVKREKEGERRGGDGELLSPFDLQERQNALSVTLTSTSLNSTTQPNRRRSKEEALGRRWQQARANSSSSARLRLPLPPLPLPLRRQRAPVSSPLTRVPEPRQRLRSPRRSLRFSEELLSG